MLRRPLSVLLSAVLAAGFMVSARPGAADPGAEIAFRTDRDHNDEIYVSAAGGAAQTNLTNSSAGDFDPAWSADGKRIAFARHQTPLGGTHIMVMKAGGCCLKKLTTVPTIDRQPAWSPDGSRIAFSRGEEDFGAFQIWVTQSDGRFPRPLTGGTPHVFNGSPAWSPDGTRIAFVSDRGGGFPKLYVMNSDGTFQQKLSTGTWADGNPDWSPDGSLIAFDRCCPEGHSSISMMPSTGGAVQRITDGSIEASNPSWAPDGTQLAFVGYPVGGGNRDIYTINADGSNLAQVTSDPWSELSPSWNPVPTVQESAATAVQSIPRAAPADPVPVLAGPPAPPPEPAVASRPHHKRKHKKKKPPPITHKTRKIAPGLRLTRVVNRKVPLRTFILRAKVTTSPLTMDVALSNNELPGFETVLSMANRHHAIAAVNGDFGLSSGRPMNIYAEDGTLDQTMFGWGNNVAVSQDETREFLGHPLQDAAATDLDTGESFPVQRVNEGLRPLFGQITEYTKAGGDFLRPPSNSCGALLTPEAPPRFDDSHRGIVRDFVVDRAGCFAKPIPVGEGVVLSGFPGDDQSLLVRGLVPGHRLSLHWTVGWRETTDTIGGYPRLLRDGLVVAKQCSLRFCGTNPRTGVGFTKDGTLLLVVVDGRQRRYSKGLSLVGFANLMKRLGAVNALNLDGGGSTTMVIRGKVINRPSDPGGPRHVSSALLLLMGADPGESSFGTDGAGATGGGARTAADSTGTAAWRLAAMDPGSTGGLLDALARGALPAVGFRLSPVLAAMLRIYRAGG